MMAGKRLGLALSGGGARGMAHVAVNLHPPPPAPRHRRQIAVASLIYFLLAAGDDPATADVYLPVPIHGLGSLVRLSQRRDLITLGHGVARDALPAICAALA